MNPRQTISHPAIAHIVNPDGASRRTILKAGVAALGLSVTGFGATRIMAQESTPAGEVRPTACVLTPELTEGPYYLDGQLIRTDITEGKPGTPLDMRIFVQDVASCTSLANAAVEIWHCDAQGVYSGVAGSAGTTFLRGTQMTDEQGMVEFATIFPGWYAGRTAHIHMMVHVDGAIVDIATDPDAVATPAGGDTYEGERTIHTGQLFFEDALSDAVFATEPYARASTRGLTFNGQDMIFAGHEDEPGFVMEITGTPAQALVGTITVGVDTSGGA